MASTQEQIYQGLDLDLSWSESALPERLRTKHVHRLHPYLGKYVPQLVEELFRRHVPARGRVLDPFAGSGTTLVQALESGLDSAGVDIAAFNCLLMGVKTGAHNPFGLEHDLREALARFERGEGDATGATPYVRRWFAPAARDHLLRFRSIAGEYEHADVLRVVLARAARSARRTTHFDLDFPKVPQLEPYWCHKHRRECRPVERADHFLRRYTLDTLTRLKEFARVRSRKSAIVLHGDARELALPGPFDAVVTSPPYPGLIDYHEQHRYAYELLGPRRPARARDRRRRARHVEGRARGVHGRDRGGSRRVRGGVEAAWTRGDRRQRPSRPVSGDPLALGARARAALPAAREPPYRPRSGEYFEDVLVAHR